MSRIIICGSTCGHNHDSVNGPTGCCAEHGPYMYFCGDCHDRRKAASRDVTEAHSDSDDPTEETTHP